MLRTHIPCCWDSELRSTYLLKQTWKMLSGGHLPKTQAIIFSSRTPKEKERSVTPNSLGLGIRFWISHTLWETHICMYAYTCTHLPRYKQLCVHLSVFFSDFSIFIWLWIPPWPRPWPLFTASSFHRYCSRLPVPGLAGQVGLLTSATWVIPLNQTFKGFFLSYLGSFLDLQVS